MTWKREKKLVEDIIKEKYDLDKLVSELTKLKSNELLNKHIQLIHRQIELNNLFNACFNILTLEEQKILQMHAIDRLADFEIGIELGFSERTTWERRKKATLKFAKLINFYYE